MVVMARLKSRLLVSSRSCLSEPAELRVLYNGKGMKIKEEPGAYRRFKVKVQGLRFRFVPIVQAVQAVQVVIGREAGFPLKTCGNDGLRKDN